MEIDTSSISSSAHSSTVGSLKKIIWFSIFAGWMDGWIKGWRRRRPIHTSSVWQWQISTQCRKCCAHTYVWFALNDVFCPCPMYPIVCCCDFQISFTGQLSVHQNASAPQTSPSQQLRGGTTAKELEVSPWSSYMKVRTGMRWEG